MNSQTLIASGGILFGLMLITALLTRGSGVRRGNRLLAASLALTILPPALVAFFLQRHIAEMNLVDPIR